MITSVLRGQLALKVSAMLGAAAQSTAPLKSRNPSTAMQASARTTRVCSYSSEPTRVGRSLHVVDDGSTSGGGTTGHGGAALLGGWPPSGVVSAAFSGGSR